MLTLDCGKCPCTFGSLDLMCTYVRRSCLYHFISLLLWEQNMACEKENELALARAKMRLVRWMCGVYQLDRYSSVALRDMLGLEENIFSMLQQNRL